MFDRQAAPAIIVGVGYPTDDLAEWSRGRVLDLAPWVDTGTAGRPSTRSQSPTGGGEFLLSCAQPLLTRVGLALRTMAVAAGVVRDRLIAAANALIAMSAE